MVAYTCDAGVCVEISRLVALEEVLDKPCLGNKLLDVLIHDVII
jgi:hypothetical protein